MRIFDDKVEFFYDKNAPLYHDEFRFDPLLSLIDFYMYIVIGYDFDTYEPFGGTEFFDAKYMELAEILKHAKNKEAIF
ncbi:protein of unknown function (DUF4835) [Candidatus Kryptonium thompsonii]|nr:protein of unknown function (DUF4835) [Candidatus Kryptonium thompsoni]